MGELSALKQRHVVRDLVVSPSSPASPEVKIRGAIFECWSPGGHVWFALSGTGGLKEALHISGDSLDWKWWQKKVASMETSIEKFGMYEWTCRPSQQYAGQEKKTPSVERCLPFGSISLSLLLVVFMRSAFTSSPSKGRAADPEVRLAFQRVLNALFDQLPEDFGGH